MLKRNIALRLSLLYSIVITKHVATEELLEQKGSLLMHRPQKIEDLPVEVTWFHYFPEAHALSESSHFEGRPQMSFEKQETGRNP